jgi:hypothetical protein
MQTLQDRQISQDQQTSRNQQTLQLVQEVIYHVSQKNVTHYHPISRLVMRRYDECMLCNLRSDTTITRYSMDEYLTGWLFCNTCKTNGLITRTVRQHMVDKKTIPCNWILSKKPTRILKFIGNPSLDRGSIGDQKIEINDASIDDIGFYVLKMSKTYNQLYVKLDTKDEKNINIQYPISLANLFAHNPGLYEEMLLCKNYTGVDGIVIGYDDMTDEIKSEIKKSYDHAIRFQSGIDTMEF